MTKMGRNWICYLCGCWYRIYCADASKRSSRVRVLRVIGYGERVIDCETCKAQQEIRRKQTRYERLQEATIKRQRLGSGRGPQRCFTSAACNSLPARGRLEEWLVREPLQTPAAHFTCACSSIPSGRWTAHRTAQQVHTSMYSHRY